MEEPIEDTAEEFEFVQGETDAEIIASCFNAYAMVDMIDTGMMNKKERDRILDIKRMAIELTHQSLKAIYDANQPTPES